MFLHMTPLPRLLAAVLLVGLALTGLALTGPARAETVTFSGSTTVQSRILLPLKDDIRRTTGLDIDVEGIGSGKGLARLVAGEVAAAIVSSPLGPMLAKAGLPGDGTYREHVIAEDVIVPIVHASNPVERLSWPQLAGLYSGRTANWKAVGGPDLPVLVVTSHPASATREVVWEQVLGKQEDYARDAHIVYATRKEMVLVAERPGAIGAVSEGFVQQYQADANSSGDPVEIKVVQTERIARPLSIITKGEPSPAVKQILDFLRSDAARAQFR